VCPSNYGFGTKRVTFSIWSWQEARYAICHFLQGRPDEARPLFSKALAFSKEHKEEEVASWILGWSGPQFEDVTGEVQHALSNAQQTVELASRCGSPLTTTSSLYMLGWAQLLHGLPDDAVASLERARHLHLAEKQARGWTDLTLALLAEAYLAVDQNDEAREMANAELYVPDARTCRLRARISQARVLRALDGAAATPRIEALLDDADLMLEQSAAYGYGPMIAEERARLAIVNGAAPREQLRPLVARYGEVGAIGHVRRLEAELGA
jgi:tetratricopeptide (TPR) repeat protein